MKISQKMLIILFFIIINMSFLKTNLFSYDFENIKSILNNRNSLKLEDFVILATKQNPYFEKILIDELKLKYNRFLDMPTEQFLLDLKTNYYFKNEIDEESISLSRLFLNQGTTISAGYEYSDKDTDREAFLISLNQSLLQNAFGKANRLKISEIELSNKIIKYEIIEAYEEYLTELINLYYEWNRIFLNLEVAHSIYNYNLDMNENIKNRYKSNIANLGDMEKSNIQILQKQEDLKNLEVEYIKIYNLIIQATRSDPAEKFVPYIKLNNLDIDLTGFEIDFLTQYKDFQEKSRTYFIYDLMREKNMTSLKLAKNNNLDNLDLNLSFRDAKNTQYKGIFAGIAYQGRFFDKKKDAELKVAEIEYNKTLLDISIQKYNIHIILKNLYEDLLFQKDLLNIYDEKIKKAEIVLKEDRKYYENGRLALSDLISTINTYEDYRREKINAIFNLKSSSTNWENATDKLVNDDNVFKNKDRK